MKYSLASLLRPRREKAKPAEHPTLSYVGLEHIEPQTARLLGTVPAATMRSSANYFRRGDVLYSRLRPYLNKVWRADRDGLCSSEFIVFPDNERLTGDFLRYRLTAPDFVSFANRLNTGDRPRVDFEQISSFSTWLPSIDEQRRIVAEIEKQFTRLDVAVASFKNLKAKFKAYRASVLEAAVRGRLLIGQHSAPETDDQELPEGWAWSRLEQLRADEPNAITDGPFGSNLKTEHYTDSGPRVIRLQNIGDGVFIDGTASISEAHYHRLQRHRVFAGDLVIAAFGAEPPRACIIPSTVGPAIVKADCIRFKPHESISASYLNLALNSPPVRRATKRLVHGVGRPRLNLGEIKSIRVPVPPRREQDLIAAEVDRRLSIIEGLETIVQVNLKRATNLRQSILHRAFSGQL